ncbi:MAG: DUF1492 domain-containing protein [Oscillospiraceae bacterium]|nr:DUF1492 domain-containing protein [Oscillospiraceae bacterium]
MTAKEYLKQYKTLDAQIDAKLAQINRLRERARYVSAAGSDGIHGSAPGDKVGELTAKIVDLEREINSEIDRLVDLKREIKENIAKLPDAVHRTVLEMKYINGWTALKIALRLNYAQRTVYLYERDALESFAVFCSNCVV